MSRKSFLALIPLLASAVSLAPGASSYTTSASILENRNVPLHRPSTASRPDDGVSAYWVGDEGSIRHLLVPSNATSSVTSYDNTGVCHECKVCENQSYSYLCGRLRCQCYDSVETCTLVVETLDVQVIKAFYFNASGDSYLNETTTDDLHGTNADFKSILSSPSAVAREIRVQKGDITGSLVTQEMDTLLLNVTCLTNLQDAFVEGKLTGLDAMFGGVIRSPHLETNQITTVNITTKAWAMLIEAFVKGTVLGSTADFSEGLDSYVLRAQLAEVSGSTTLGKTNLTEPLTGTDGSFSGKIISNLLSSTQLDTVELRVTNNALLGNTTIWGNLTIRGDFLVTGNVDIIGNWDITGNVLMEGDLTVNGNTDITGNFTQEGTTCTFLDTGEADLSGDIVDIKATLDSEFDTGMTIEGSIVTFNYFNLTDIIDAVTSLDFARFPAFSLTLTVEYVIPLNPPYPYLGLEFEWVPTITLDAWFVYIKGDSIPVPLPSIFTPLTVLAPSVLLAGPTVKTSGSISNSVEALLYVGMKATRRIDIGATFCCVRFYAKIAPDLIQLPGTGSIDLILDPAGSPFPGFETLMLIDSNFVIVSEGLVLIKKTLTIIAEEINIVAAVEITGKVMVTGDVTIEGAVQILGGILSVTGETNLDGDVTITGGLEVVGASTFQAVLTVNGVVTAAAMEFSGDVAFANMEAETVTADEVTYGDLTGTTLEATDLVAAETEGSILSSGFVDCGSLAGGSGEFGEVTASLLIGYPIFPFRRHLLQQEQRAGVRQRQLQVVETNSREEVQAQMASILDTTASSSPSSPDVLSVYAAERGLDPAARGENVALVGIYANQPNEVGQLSGTHWFSLHAFEIDPGVNASGQSLLALKTDGDLRVNGVLFATPQPALGEEDSNNYDTSTFHPFSNDLPAATATAADAVDRSCFIASGSMPRASFQPSIHPGSFLIDGTPTDSSSSSSSSSGEGRLYASTFESISPIYTTTAECSIASGRQDGASSTIHLPSPYAIGQVAGFQSSTSSGSQRIPAPNVLEVKALDEQGTNYTVHCQAPSAPAQGQAYTYRANLMFLHPILVHS